MCFKVLNVISVICMLVCILSIVYDESQLPYDVKTSRKMFVAIKIKATYCTLQLRLAFATSVVIVALVISHDISTI